MEPHWYVIGWSAAQAAAQGLPGLCGFTIGSLLGLLLLWLILKLEEKYDILWRLFKF